MKCPDEVRYCTIAIKYKDRGKCEEVCERVKCIATLGEMIPAQTRRKLYQMVS